MTTHPAHPLPPALNHWVTLGFTGHRELAQPELIRERLAECLAKLKEQFGNLATVSSAASGADTLFLEVAEDLGLPSSIILPFSTARFEQDFTPQDWGRVQRQLDRALELRVVEPCENDAEAHLDASVQTVERCDLLLAVLDTEHAGGKGGTADTVRYAQTHNKIILVLDPHTGAVEIKGNMSALQQSPSLSIAPRAQVEASLDFYDGKAKANAPMARRFSALIILLHLLATGVAVMGVVLHSLEPWSSYTGAFKIFALILAWVMVLRLHHHQQKWLNARPAAELCRYFLSIWTMQRRPLNTKWVAGVGFTPLIRDLALAWQLDKSAELPMEQAKHDYLENRIQNQLDHYRDKLKLPALLHKLTRYLTAPLTLVAIAGGIIALSAESGSLIYEMAKLTSMLVPLLVAALLAMAISLDSPRRNERYKSMADKLETSKAPLMAAQTWPSLWRAVDKIEYELLNELEEWHSLSRFSNIH